MDICLMEESKRRQEELIVFIVVSSCLRTHVDESDEGQCAQRAGISSGGTTDQDVRCRPHKW